MLWMTNRSQLSDNSKNIKIMMLYPGNIDASKFIENIKRHSRLSLL